MFTVFDTLHDSFMGKDEIEAIAVVSIHEDYGGDNTSLTITEVLDGDPGINEYPFEVENSLVDIDFCPHGTKYLVRLEVSRYEGTSQFKINCLNIQEIKH